MRQYNPLFLTSLIFLFTSSCAGTGGSPTNPAIDDLTSELSQSERTIAGGPALWGIWYIEWNESAQDFDIVPLRSAEFACNVVKFMNNFTGSISLHINGVDHQADYVEFDLDMGFTHPFPGLSAYTGFDVCGVFMGDGSEIYPGPDGLEYPGEFDQQLMNPDGYTRRFNAPEFTGAGQILPLQGYFPGKIATPDYIPTARLNPYKYHADWLDADDDAFQFLEDTSIFRGRYQPGSTNFRNYIIRFPNDKKSFEYAILANWEPNIHHPSPPTSLADFPASANSEEALVVNIVDHTNAWYASDVDNGGAVTLEITPWDWSAECAVTMEEYEIRLYSPAWTGAYDLDMTPIAQSDYQYTFQASIPGSELIDNGSQPVWVEVIYPDFDYTSHVGVPNDANGALTSYFRTSVNILEHDPTVVTDNFIYGFADSQFFDFANLADNAVLLTNMLNLPLTGPYAENNIVMYYEGHTGGYIEYIEFTNLVESLGYESVYINAWPYVTLDTTGVKMLVLATFYSKGGEFYTDEEVQNIKDLVDGGGLCIICCDHQYVSGNTETVDKLIADLGLDFSFPGDTIADTFPYTDFTPDPITLGVTEIEGKDSGRFEVFGDGVSIMRGFEDFEYTAICKSPPGW